MTFSKMAAFAAFLVVLPVSAVAQQMPTAEQCTAWFDKADANKDGSLGQQEEAAKYVGMISGNTESDNNSSTAAEATIVSKDDFLAACGKGTFGMPTN